MTILNQAISLVIIISLTNCKSREKEHVAANNDSIVYDSSHIQIIKALFSKWQADKIASGAFWAKDSCYMGYFADHTFDGTIDDMWGFPDSSEIRFSFADVNQDSVVDGLVAFNPVQCDGGNGSMWEQKAVLMFSKGSTYSIQDTILSGMFNYLGKSPEGFIHLNGIGTNKLLGTYYEFKDGDGHCCPSVERKVTIEYNSGKVIIQ